MFFLVEKCVSALGQAVGAGRTFFDEKMQEVSGVVSQAISVR